MGKKDRKDNLLGINLVSIQPELRKVQYLLRDFPECILVLLYMHNIS